MAVMDFIMGFGFAFLCIIVGSAIMANSQPPSAISFTVVDHDISDNTIYTSNGEILVTNKYQWKLLELNKTYVCDEGFVNHFSNCHEQRGDA